MVDTPALEFKNINKSFSGVHVLKDVSFKIGRGETHALIGENGAGKSTLIKILSGAYTKDSGEILLDGNPVEIKNPLHAKSLGISIIYQELTLIPQLNAEENAFLGNIPTSKSGLLDWKTTEREAQRVFSTINLDIDTKAPVRELSAAQRQLIEVARSLLDNAKIIVMDEPTSSLTNNEIKALFKVIAQLKARGVTIIYISHKLEELFQICDTVSVLKDGVITGHSKMKDIIKQDLIRMMVGRDLQDYYPTRNPKIGEVVLECRNLNHGRQVQDVSFTVRKGEIVGFSGLVGAGRTETMRSIFGADKLESGDILVHGKEVQINSPLQAIKNGIAFATEDRKTQGLVLCLSNAHNMTLASLDTIANKRRLLDAKKEFGIVEKYISKLSIKTTGANQKIVFLSGGNQQKVIIAKWLNTSANIYIFDEPTRGIDVGAKAEIYRLMSDLADQGAAIIMISSELPEILGMSDRIIVMCGGRITGEVMRQDATEELIMSYAFGGNSE